ncbi:MAG TPA: hypothetical protein VNU21_19855 [Usitatibacter sp.]|jgi:hypothetical protein|nr:hypothetical protein [Usitatibacter sp.]
MAAIPSIRYRDIAEAEGAEQDRLTARSRQLDLIAKTRIPTPDEEKEKRRIDAVLAAVEPQGNATGVASQRKKAEVSERPVELCERLYVSVRDLFDARPGLLGGTLHNHVNGVLRMGERKDGDAAFCQAALTIGLLTIDVLREELPIVVAAAHGTDGYRIVADTTSPEWTALHRKFFAAVGEAQSMGVLAQLVLPLLANEGDPRGPLDKSPGTVDAEEFARVMRWLADHNVGDDQPQLRRYLNEALNVIQNRNADGSDNELGIDIPDFEAAAEASIVKENVQAIGVFLCGAMFEELKVFEVVDKLVELFQLGMLTRTSESSGQLLYKYWKDTSTRMSEAERRNFYAMTMGIPGGTTTGMVNREFNDLWLRFVSSVSSFVRKNEVDRLLRAPVPAAISQQQVRKAARDLAVNLSMHGYGMTFHAARDLQAQIRLMINLLGDRDIMANYGARDMWQVVDQVATLELGGAKTTSRYRTLATCGAIITAWLATNIDRITRSTKPIIDMDEVRTPAPRTDNSKATTTPSDYDLVNACELWLADTGTGETVIDQMAQPRETPVMTSRPVQIPAMAREMLADLPGMGLGYQAQH